MRMVKVLIGLSIISSQRIIDLDTNIRSIVDVYIMAPNGLWRENLKKGICMVEIILYSGNFTFVQ